MTSYAKLTQTIGRVLSALCLYIGLALAARLLGVGGGSQNPVNLLGVTAFTWLAVLTLGYLFAAVGVWMSAAWGLVVAIGTALCELVLAMMGDASVRLPMLDFFLALIVVVVAGGLFIVVEIKPFSSLHD